MIGGYRGVPDLEILGLVSAVYTSDTDKGSHENYKFGIGVKYAVAENTSIQATMFKSITSSRDWNYNSFNAKVKYEFGKSNRVGRHVTNRFHDADAVFGIYD